ncbi:hypothetical protein F4802DRAFT_559953 [Xylaria palmicola]|nr:hypothetical protein F4802DRAFT_559953 [Xylaria palmicola]
MDTVSDDAAGTAPELVPISGATLFRREIERRRRCHRRGVIPSGCSEIDDALLVGGGFERGCVVGVSAEEMDFGVLLGLQTIAHTLVSRDAPDGHVAPSHGERRPRAAVITPLPVTTILPALQDAIRAQVRSRLGRANPSVDSALRRCLEAISISRIFDLEGLWEVLRELADSPAEPSRRHRDGGSEVTSDGAREPGVDEEVPRQSGVQDATSGIPDEDKEKASMEEEEEEQAQAEEEESDHIPPPPPPGPIDLSSEPATQLPPLRIGPELRVSIRKPEILDSEDEEPFSSSPLSSPPPSTAEPASPSPSSEHHPRSATTPEPPDPTTPAAPESETQPHAPPPVTDDGPSPGVPDIILITHFSSLLTTLFARSDRQSAHAAAGDLASHLRDLSRSAAGPLIMLLNTTTTNVPIEVTAPSGPPPMVGEPRGPAAPLEPTLRSIFAPAGPGDHHDHHPPHLPHRAGAARRRTKPAFGATFARLLDLHLLCTRVPRTRADARATATTTTLGHGRSAWVVEALLDELGVWRWDALSGEESGREKRDEAEEEEGEEEVRLPPRVNREQRWGAVDVRGGVRIVDAFPARGGR